MAQLINRTRYLRINGVTLACPAWQVMDFAPLYEDGDVRESELTLPGAAGQRSFPDVLHSKTYTFPFEVVGMTDSSGAPIVDSAAGLDTHFDFLRSALGQATSSGDGTVPVFYVKSPSTALYNRGKFRGFKGSRLLAPAVVRTTFDLFCPSSVWTVTTP